MHKIKASVKAILATLIVAATTSAQSVPVSTLTDVLLPPTMGAVNANSDSEGALADIVWLHKTNLSRDVVSVETYLTSDQQNQPEDKCSLQNGIKYYLVTAKRKLATTGANIENWKLLNICVSVQAGTADYSIYIDSSKPNSYADAKVTTTRGARGLSQIIEIPQFKFEGRLLLSMSAQFQHAVSEREDDEAHE